MTQLPIPNLFAVEVTEDAVDFEMSNHCFGFHSEMSDLPLNTNGWRIYRLGLMQGRQYEIIGTCTPTEMSFDPEPYVESKPSFRSSLTSAGITDYKKLVILKKI